MQAPEIATLLGHPLTDDAVERALTRFSIDDRPEIEIDPDDVDGPVVGTQDWVGNHDAGIEFGFEDRAAFMAEDDSEHGTGPMILTEIYFYGDHPDVQPYQGTLPFGLKISDDRNAVRSKLAALEKTRRSYVRDTWEADAFRMTIAYAGSEARIGFVLCMLRYSAPPPPPLELAGGVLPAINTIVGLLGVAANDQRLRDTFEPLGLSRQLRTEATGLEADFRSKYGFELRFGKVGSSSTSVLTQFLCYRDRELDSRQWEGQLPFGMHFDDSPETVQGRVGRPPDDREDEEVTGYAMWHSDAFDLYVYYSTMENFILSVRIVAPGVSNLGGD